MWRGKQDQAPDFALDSGYGDIIGLHSGRFGSSSGKRNSFLEAFYVPFRSFSLEAFGALLF